MDEPTDGLRSGTMSWASNETHGLAYPSMGFGMSWPTRAWVGLGQASAGHLTPSFLEMLTQD